MRGARSGRSAPDLGGRCPARSLECGAGSSRRPARRRAGPASASRRASGSTGSTPRRCSHRSTARPRGSTARRDTRSSSRRAGPETAMPGRRSPLGLGAVDQVVDELLEGDLAPGLLLWRRVFAHLSEALLLSQRLVVALVEQLDVDLELYMSPGHGASVAG